MLLLLLSFGAATPGVFVLSAIIAQKIHCIWSGSYSVKQLTVNYLLNPENWIRPKVNTERSQMNDTFSVNKRQQCKIVIVGRYKTFELPLNYQTYSIF